MTQNLEPRKALMLVINMKLGMQNQHQIKFTTKPLSRQALTQYNIRPVLAPHLGLSHRNSSDKAVDHNHYTALNAEKHVSLVTTKNALSEEKLGAIVIS